MRSVNKKNKQPTASALMALMAWALLVGQPVAADSVPATIAMGKIPAPTFRDVHSAYVRIVANESGFTNIADMDGILRSLSYGIDKLSGIGLTRLMRRMAFHSKRTFPFNSPFLNMTSEERERLEKSKDRQNQWASTVKLDCSLPSGWTGDAKLWKKVYADKCKELVKVTRQFLLGELPSKCDGQPTTWGSETDSTRPGGPIKLGWKEIFCDYANNCKNIPIEDRYKSAVCARNRYWSWIERAK